MLPLCMKKFLGTLAVLALATAPALSPAFAQVQNVDPNDVIDADLAAPDYDGNFDSGSSILSRRPARQRTRPKRSATRAACQPIMAIPFRTMI